MEKYLNVQWIRFEAYGWTIVCWQTILTGVMDRLMAQKDRRILHTKFGTRFIELYTANVQRLLKYTTQERYDELQKISNSCWWNKIGKQGEPL